MNPHSTHRSAIWLSVVLLTLLSATAVFADGQGPKPPKDDPTPPITRRPDPPPTPDETKPKPTESPTDSPVVGRTDNKPSPPQPTKDTFWWWITASILLLLLLLFLAWILRRRQTGYAKPPSTPTPPAYPPIDQSKQQY